MKLAYIGTYPPRKCGIGTFTQNLASAMLTTEKVDEIIVIAINDHDLKYNYPPEVKLSIDQENQSEYRNAANFINESGADACILEHEFGIFGGLSGVYILSLLHRLQIPVISTFHTILETPSYNEKIILKEICRMSSKVVVMSHKAVHFLMDIYGVPKQKIALIEHGLPDIKFDQETSRKELKLQDKKLLLTFGFIGRSKGIETVINALPKILEKHPNVLYIVLGKTHPNVLRDAGEEYREYLQELAKTLGVEKNVLMINEFLDENELFKYLAACDIYITPYLSVAQITSGTLTYAMGSGCAVVSTPYWHAAELLADDKGKLFDFNDYEGLAQVINQLLGEPQTLAKIQKKASDYGKTITWPKIGQKYANVVENLLSMPQKSSRRSEHEIDLTLMPSLSLSHIKRLTDDTGIIQHAKFGIPDFKEGYCLDDNARALLMACMYYRQEKDPEALELMTVYLSYIHYMQNENGTFRNFLSFNRNFLDEEGSEDSFGRTIWALGYLLSNASKDAFYQTASELFSNAVPNFGNIKSIRGIAYTILGICYYLKRHSYDNGMKRNLRTLTETLVWHYNQNQSEDWKWFEVLLAYDNGILPLALLQATNFLKDNKVTDVALASMNFLIEHTLKDGYLSIIGNKDWYVRNKERSIFAQQPIDAQAMVLLCHEAYKLTGDRDYLDKLFTCFMWFLGENDMRMSLYNYETEGCSDGFEIDGVNRNQGAESTLAYFISYLTVLQAYEESFHLHNSIKFAV
ncbi:glycosyltransferase [Aequorivita sp. H23M31]|uniref:Glycosyltransferase n=1 Tax=Aequorivita ciconiae TaxID=2494375 RepID=A0A410G737_9FLAO|nr:glycosyltransferase family 4 protein [Aequorivita sp. H23M31]QAA83076.1 glycosyltransferase [Aequorivita sp. H23M31]